MSVSIRPLAQLEILELAEGLGAVYSGVGQSFLAQVDETIAFLERFPLVGSLPPDVLPADPAIRVFPVRRFRNHLIVFKPLPDNGGIEVVRVLDGRRDLGGLLDES